ncbi:TonB C-terminal domain-containing protein [Paraburkholderia sabiae]|uniref:Energy transducer TonB n=1 Tax=Paraburkholderia sabiae TaxID=273251 RepID=A0ABU9QCB0_9BURK|nr:energy transducer TonB [Paraburkholderia sabiae]WJZ72625.1 energy transducer TonB [Paraburkholderia sabiae]CAD6558464.1 hypothetical protein LMG24235_06389 [Paraburkholderia sabiae]
MTRTIRILALAIAATTLNGAHAQASPRAVFAGFSSYAARNSFANEIRRLVRGNLVWSGPFDKSISTVIEVQCATDGKLLSATIYRASGNPAWDSAAVQRSDPMPSDVNGNTPTHFKITVLQK